MKSPLTLAIASALLLTACSANSTLDVPASTPASLPAIPEQIDRDPEPLGQLPNGELGTVVLDSATGTKRYGELAVRFNTLRAFYNCVRQQHNAGESLAGCVK